MKAIFKPNFPSWNVEGSMAAHTICTQHSVVKSVILSILAAVLGRELNACLTIPHERLMLPDLIGLQLLWRLFIFPSHGVHASFMNTQGLIQEPFYEHDSTRDKYVRQNLGTRKLVYQNKTLNFFLVFRAFYYCWRAFSSWIWGFCASLNIKCKIALATAWISFSGEL